VTAPRVTRAALTRVEINPATFTHITSFPFMTPRFDFTVQGQAEKYGYDERDGASHSG
jgi:hypothetical protein